MTPPSVRATSTSSCWVIGYRLSVGGQPAGWFCQSVKGTLSTHRHRAGPGWFCIPARWPAPHPRARCSFPRRRTRGLVRPLVLRRGRPPRVGSCSWQRPHAGKYAGGCGRRHIAPSRRVSHLITAPGGESLASSRSRHAPTGGMSIRRVPLALA